VSFCGAFGLIAKNNPACILRVQLADGLIGLVNKNVAIRKIRRRAVILIQVTAIEKFAVPRPERCEKWGVR